MASSLLTSRDYRSILSIIDEAGVRLIRNRGLWSASSTKKPDGSLLCAADLEIERFIANELALITPDIPVICEESNPLERGSTAWTLDPLDGTAAYLKGEPTFGIMLGLVQDHVPVAGWITGPMLQQTAWSNGQDLVTRGMTATHSPAATSLNDIRAIVAAGDFDTSHRSAIAAAANNLALIRGTTTCTSDYLQFLGGRWDCLIYRRSFSWDHAAGVCLALAAGAAVTRFDGSPIRFFEDGIGVFATWTSTVQRLCACLLPNAGADSYLAGRRSL